MTERSLPNVRVSAPDRFVEEAADGIAGAIRDSVAARGVCRLALAGGGTPKPIYAALAGRSDVDWSAVRFFFGDERAVGPSDPSSNYRMVSTTLLEPIAASEEQVFRIHGEGDPEQAAADYDARLGAEPLDLVLLGMGGDGHTASLFPGDPGVDVTDRHVVVTTSPVAPSTRISLTLAAIDAARCVVLLVSGAGKAERLAEVWRQVVADDPVLPAARVSTERLHWHLDAPAASALPPKGNQ